MDELPSALEQLGEIRKKIEGRKPAFFLDYDGTLTPIVKHPDKALISEDMRNVLIELSKHCPVTIISGRDREDVKSKVNVEDIFYAGSHGFEITGPRDIQMESKEGLLLLPTLDDAEQELREKLESIEGVIIERKKYAIAIHYRNVPAIRESEVVQLAEEILKGYSELKKGRGKKVFEFRPNIAWDKGTAVFWILDKLRINEPEEVPIYIGDDITDEDAFKALVERDGIGILVDNHGEPTNATYSLKNVEEVKKFLLEMNNIIVQS